MHERLIIDGNSVYEVDEECLKRRNVPTECRVKEAVERQIQKEKPLNMKDAMPFLLSNMRQAKENHIDFTKPEIELLCDLLSKDLPPESQTQMKKIMSLMSMNRSHPAP